MDRHRPRKGGGGVSNPFASVESFEPLRVAALGDEQEYERYRRRDAATTRRSVGRLVELRLASRVERMIEVAIASSRAVLLVGPPGTGKTEILEQMVAKMDRDPARYGFTSAGIDAAWVTPEEEWSFEKLVLGETIVEGQIESVEGDLLQAIRANQWLILDETNRADMDRVLGGVLTWLSGKKVRVGTRKAAGKTNVPVYLEWTDRPESEVREVDTPPSVEYAAGSEWRVLGTYNAVDAQRVFRMGQALSRRFKHVPVPPASPDDFVKIIAGHVEEDALLGWFQDRVTRLYAAHLGVAEAQLGPGVLIDIPAYVEKGLQLAAHDRPKVIAPESDFYPTEAEAVDVEPDGSRSGAADGTSGPIDFVVRELTPTIEVPALIEIHDSGLLEDLLAEAYLVSAGNFIAKYEDEVLDDLAVGIGRSQALTEANWTWVVAHLDAMRA
jgi:MoxR-like ATPase